MTAQDSAQQTDADVVQRHIRHLCLQNEVSVHHQSADVLVEGSHERLTGWRVDNSSAKHMSRSEFDHPAEYRASHRANAHNSTAEGSLPLQWKGEEPRGRTGVKYVSNSGLGAADKPIPSPKKVCGQNTTHKDYKIGGIRIGEEKRFDFICSKGSDGGNKGRRSVGWSVLNGESKYETLSKSDEEEMLQLSQSSTPEKSQVGEVGSRVRFTSPKRRKTQKNGVVKRPRPFRATRLSTHIADILSGNVTPSTELHDEQQHTRGLKQVRTRADWQVLGDVGDKATLLPELSKDVESAPKKDVRLAEDDSTDDGDRLNRDAPNNLSSKTSSQPQRDSIINRPSLDIPGSKRSEGEQEQRKDRDGGVHDAADSTPSLLNSSDDVTRQETERPKRKKTSCTVRRDGDGDEELRISQKQGCGDSQYSNGLEHDAPLDDQTKPDSDAAMFSGSVKKKEEAKARIGESPKRPRKKTKQKRRARSVEKGSPSQEPSLPNEGGYIISKGGRQDAQQLRNKLLSLSLNKSSNLAESPRPATRNDFLKPGEDPPDDTSIQPEGTLDGFKDEQREQIAENSLSSGRNWRSSAHEIVTQDPEESIEPPVHNEVERHLQEVDENLPLSEMRTGTEKESRNSIEAEERAIGSPLGNRSGRRQKRKARHKRTRATGDVGHQNLPMAQGSRMSASAAEKPQSKEENYVFSTRTQVKDLKVKDDAGAYEASGSIDGPRRMMKRPRAASRSQGKREENRQVLCDENSLTGRSPSHKGLSNVYSASKRRELVQNEGGYSFPTFSRSGQGDMTAAATKSLKIRSPASEDGEKTSKALSSKESCLLRPDSAPLEGTKSFRHHGAEQNDQQCRQSGSEQPEDAAMHEEKLGTPTSSPGDMSHRNRSRVFKRKKHYSQEALPRLVQSLPSQEHGKMSKLKNNRKTAGTPSPIAKDAHKGHSARRFAVGSLPLHTSENGTGQPAIMPLGVENSDEIEEITDHDGASNQDVEEIEESALRERNRKGSPNSHLRPNDSEDGPALENATGDGSKLQANKGDKGVNEIGDLDSKSVELAKTSVAQNLDDLLDPNKLKKQSELLTRSKRSKRKSLLGGSRRDKSIKALDELSDNEDSKDKAWVPATSSETHHRLRTKCLPKAEPQKTHSMKTRARGGTSSRAPLESSTLIDLTDLTDDDITVADTRATDDDDEITESLKEIQKLSLEDKTKSIIERPRCKFLTPLSDDESKLAKDLTTRTKKDTKIVAIAEAGITLRGESFKRLRGTRWLDDEVLNAYVSLINCRNDAIFSEMDEEHCAGIPRTYVFNTYFFTRLCSGSSGFDYPGVKGWTRRAKVDILTRDIILVPINLGNHHWVLSVIDMEHKEVLYLDSMHGPDTAGAFTKLKRWVFEELRHKHGEDVALQLDPHSWKQVKNHYRIRRVGSLPAKIEPRDSVPGRMARVPKQQDSGSCGVFTAKIADCLSLGTKVYFTQKHIRLIRQRMALDLFNGYVPL